MSTVLSYFKDFLSNIRLSDNQVEAITPPPQSQCPELLRISRPNNLFGCSRSFW